MVSMAIFLSVFLRAIPGRPLWVEPSSLLMDNKAGTMRSSGPMDQIGAVVRIVGAVAEATARCTHTRVGRMQMASLINSRAAIIDRFLMYLQWLMSWQSTSRANGEQLVGPALLHLSGQQV